MAREPTVREAKLIQYLNEAYGKEKELETALKAHVAMTARDAYKKRLREHLKETQQQAKGLERRIKALGGKAELVDLPGPEVASEAAGKAVAAASKAVALAKGPLHAIRGTGEAEKMLKNAKTELFNEFEEIGNYLAIEELATALNDPDTAKLAREFRRQEERMATFLQRLIPQLAKQVVRDEVPARERKPAAAAAPRTTTTRRRSTATRARASKS
jgi:ferritin-like metal-binding protein YciE